MPATDIDIYIPKPHKAQQNIIDNATRFNVVACGRRWGKTELAKNRIVTPENLRNRIGWFAPAYKTLLEAWIEMVNTLRPITARKNEQTRRLELITGGIIEFWSLDKPDVARGRKYHMIVVDEAAIRNGQFAVEIVRSADDGCGPNSTVFTGNDLKEIAIFEDGPLVDDDGTAVGRVGSVGEVHRGAHAAPEGAVDEPYVHLEGLEHGEGRFKDESDGLIRHPDGHVVDQEVELEGGGGGARVARYHPVEEQGIVLEIGELSVRLGEILSDGARSERGQRAG